MIDYTIEELEESGLIYIPTHFRWIRPEYKVKTREYHPKGRMMTMDFMTYLEKQQESLSTAYLAHYVIVSKEESAGSPTKLITLMKITGGDYD